MAWALIFILLSLVLIAGLVFLWRRVLRRSEHVLPACGRCGYAVRGIESMHCPECGSDLREVGITNPRLTGGITPIVFLLLWSALYGVVALIIAGVAIAVGPVQQWGDCSRSFTPADSKSAYEVTVAWTWQASGREGFGNSISTGSISPPEGPIVTTLDFGHLKPGTEIDDLTLTVRSYTGTQPAPNTMSIARDGSSFEYTTPQGDTVKKSGAPDVAAIKQWFADAAIPTDPANIDAEAEDLVTLTEGLIDKQSPIVLNRLRSGGGSSGTTGAPQLWWVALVLCSLVGIWIAGIVIYFRRRRQQKADAAG